MGRRPKRKAPDTNQDKEARGEMHQEHHQDPGRALVAISKTFIATCCGSELRIFNRRAAKSVELDSMGAPSQSIRAVKISNDERYVLAGGDDRMLRIWETGTGELVCQWLAAKKISAADFHPDCKSVVFADKGGDVYSASIEQGSTQDSSLANPSQNRGMIAKGRFLLGHFSTIITAMCLSKCGKRLTTADREGKIRINKLPCDLSKGAPCIQSFALGHSAFVTAVTEVECCQQATLLSCSGDGTLRLWDRESGAQLDCYQASFLAKNETPCQEGLPSEPPPHHQASAAPDEDTSQQAVENPIVSPEKGIDGTARQTALNPEPSMLEDSAEDDDGNGTQRDDVQTQGREKLPPAVLHLCFSDTRNWGALCVEGSPQIKAFTITDDRKISVIGEPKMSHCTLPNSLAFDSSNNLWAVSGCEGHIPHQISAVSSEDITSQIETEHQSDNGTKEPPSAMCEGDIAASRIPCSLESEKVPSSQLCTDELCQALGVMSTSQSAGTAQAGLDSSSYDLPGIQVSQELRKWVIAGEERERRKRNRSDQQRKPPQT